MWLWSRNFLLCLVMLPIELALSLFPFNILVPDQLLRVIRASNDTSVSPKIIWNEIDIFREEFFLAFLYFLLVLTCKQWRFLLLNESLIEIVINVTYWFFKFEAFINLVECFWFEEHVPHFEHSQQLMERPFPKVVFGFLPNKWKQETNFQFKEFYVVSLDLFDYYVNHIN